MNKDIPQVGQYLRYEREKTDVTVEEIASKLKLPVAVIKSIEEGNQKDLPEAVYVKGYIRAYCSLINIDPAPAIKLFTDQTEANRPIQEAQSFSPIVNEHAQYLTRVWGTVLVLAIIAFILISGWSEQEEVLEEKPKMMDIESKDSASQPDIKDTQNNDTQNSKVLTDTLQKESSQSEEISQPNQQLDTGEVLITLVAQAPSWARVYNRENEIVRRMLPSGYTKNFVIKLPVHIELGDARNVEVFLNEEKYDLAPHISNLNTAFFVIEKLPTSR